LPPKILKASMDEVVWPPNPLQAQRQGLNGHCRNMKGYLDNMAQVVIMLLRQCDDQIKIRLLWI
jgi:hypothetical protein